MSEDTPNAKDIIKRTVDRIIMLEEEKAALSASIKAEYAQAKVAGIEVKPLKRVVKLVMEAPEDRIKREKIESTAELYYGNYIQVGFDFKDGGNGEKVVPIGAAKFKTKEKEDA